jgi:hypothetical protein
VLERTVGLVKFGRHARLLSESLQAVTLGATRAVRDLSLCGLFQEGCQMTFQDSNSW